MTDRERWLTCTDPAAMLAALGDAADERRCELAVRRMRELHDKRSVADQRWSDPSRTWKNLLSGAWLEPPVCDLIRCIWPSPFIERERTECGNCNGLGSIETMDSICQLVECKMCKGKGFTLAMVECPECKNWSIRQKESITRMNCKTCNDTLFVIAQLIDPRWRTPLVMDLARRAKGNREPYVGPTGPPAPEVLPILADALMDAGCDSEEIINHCRGDGPHVRGCWVVDLLLGKK